MSKARRIADYLNIIDSADAIDIRAVYPGYLTERTTYGSGTDLKPLIDAAGTALRSRTNVGRGRIYLPGGKFTCSAPLDDDAIAGHHIIGPGSQALQFYYDNTSGNCFRYDGENTSVGWSGGGLSGLWIKLGAAALGGGTPRAINLQGVSVSGTVAEPDEFTLRDVYIGAETAGTARWYQGMQVYGNDRTAPQGIRVGTIDNLQIFDCTNLAFYGSSLVQWGINNLGSYTGTGTGNDIHITGGGTASTNSTQVSLMNLLCSGTLTIANCSDIWVFAKTAGLSVSAATNCGGVIDNSGSLAGAFTTSDVTIL